jgi:hypothetical protein
MDAVRMTTSSPGEREMAGNGGRKWGQTTVSEIEEEIGKEEIGDRPRFPK